MLKRYKNKQNNNNDSDQLSTKVVKNSDPYATRMEKQHDTSCSRDATDVTSWPQRSHPSWPWPEPCQGTMGTAVRDWECTAAGVLSVPAVPVLGGARPVQVGETEKGPKVSPQRKAAREVTENLHPMATLLSPHGQYQGFVRSVEPVVLWLTATFEMSSISLSLPWH